MCRMRETTVVGVVVPGLGFPDAGAALGRLSRVGGLGSGEGRYSLRIGGRLGAMDPVTGAIARAS